MASSEKRNSGSFGSLNPPLAATSLRSNTAPKPIDGYKKEWKWGKGGICETTEDVCRVGGRGEMNGEKKGGSCAQSFAYGIECLPSYGLYILELSSERILRLLSKLVGASVKSSEGLIAADASGVFPSTLVEVSSVLDLNLSNMPIIFVLTT